MENILEEYKQDCLKLDTANLVIEMIHGRRDLSFIERRKMITVQKDFARSLLYWFKVNHEDKAEYRIFCDQLCMKILKMQ